MGLEPTTYAMRRRRSTNWANPPTLKSSTNQVLLSQKIPINANTKNILIQYNIRIIIIKCSKDILKLDFIADLTFYIIRIK